MLNVNVQWRLGYITIGMLGLVYIVNFIMMIVVVVHKIKWLVRKVKQHLAKRKAKKKWKKGT